MCEELQSEVKKPQKDSSLGNVQKVLIDACGNANGYNKFDRNFAFELIGLSNAIDNITFFF